MTTAVETTGIRFYHSKIKEKWKTSRQTAEENPFLFIFTFLLAVAVGWFVEKGLDSFLPDTMLAQVENLQKDIELRTGDITTGINSLQTRLADMNAQDLSKDDLAQIVSEIETLTSNLNLLTPSLSRVSEMSQGLSERTVQAKAEELRRTKYSAQADVLLTEKTGAQICGEGISFGLDHFNGSDAFTYISRNDSTSSRWLSAGQSIGINTPQGIVSVAFVGRVGTEADGFYGFNVACNGTD